MIIPDGFVRGRSAATRSIYVVALCSMLFACGGGGGDDGGIVGGSGSGSGSGGGSGSGDGSTPATSLSCDGYPQTENGTTRVCLILREYAQVTPNVSASTNAGNMTGHGFDILNAYVVYARIIAQDADQGRATALAQSVVINTANSKIYATPDHVDSPQFLSIDFEIFTAKNTNLTMTSSSGNMSVDNYNSTVNLTPNSGNASLTAVQGQATVKALSGNVSLTDLTLQGPVTVTADSGNVSLTNVQGQGQVTVDVGGGNISATLSGSGWTGAGMNATTQSGNISVARPAAYQAAFTAKSDVGRASIDDQHAESEQGPAVVTAGSGAPIMLESKEGNVSVTAAQ